MNTTTLANPIDYVHELSIDETQLPFLLKSRKKLLSTNQTENKDAGLVDNGSLVSFVANVSGVHREDILNSTLLAQLGANKAHNRFDDVVNWYKKYVEILEHVGWVIQSFDFTKYHGSGTTVTMDKVRVQLLEAIASENEVAVTKSTMDALNALDDGNDKLVLWDSSSSHLEKGNFQIGVASEDNGALVFRVAASHFNSEENHARFLWWGYNSSEIDLFTSSQAMTLNEQSYGKVRQKIADKLGVKIGEYIDDLDI
jgi:hypothetical protein